MTTRRWAKFGMGLFLLAATTCSQPEPQKGFADTWVMKLGSRVFIVLTLRDERGDFTGQFIQPESMQTSDGINFTGIGRTVVARPVTHGTVEGMTLRFTVENPQDKSDTDKYELTLDGMDHAELKWLGVPIALRPLRLSRRAESEFPTIATDWDPLTTYSAEQPEVPSSKTMDTIYAADQAARQNQTQLSKEQWKAIEQTDAERRQEVRRLLEMGALQTGDDFRKAAFIFQHGDNSQDYLLAHTLALVALAKGDRSAAWIAAATLDRYLTSIKQPQIYGTQFSKDNTHMPFEQTVISDALRRSLNVPPIAEQQAPK